MTEPHAKNPSPLIYVLFFLSGASALMYQVVWVRMLGLVFGVTAFAVATVLSSFMAGLAFGNFFFGKRADTHPRPLKLYALLELGVAVLGFCFPFMLATVKTGFVALTAHWQPGIYVMTPVRFLFSFALLFIPTMLMGGTLPVVSKYVVKKRHVVGHDVGELYSVNNLGAVVGCLAAGFFCIMLLGVRGTLYAAAAINTIVSLAAWFLGRSKSSQPAEHPALCSDDIDTDAPDILPQTLVYLVLWFFSIEGFAALAYEVVWIRILSASVLMNSVYSFCVVTASFILGLSLGGFIAARFIDRKRDLLSLFACVEFAVGFSSILLLVLFTNHSMVHHVIVTASQGGFWRRTLFVEFALAFFLLLVPTTLMGMTFPLVAKIKTASVKSIGRNIGLVGSLNTVGSIFGSLAAGFVLIPLLGMYRSILVLACVNFLLGIVPFTVNPLKKINTRIALMTVLCLCFGCLLAAVPGHAFFWRNMGREAGNSRLLYYAEDYAASVAVVESRSFEGPVKYMEVDGICVAGTDMALKTTQKLQAHIPLLFYESINRQPAEKVLIVGLGSGGTSYSASLHEVRSITCVELLPGVVQSARTQFTEVNNRVFDDPRYRITLGDGRNYVLTTPKRYDAILTESVHPIYAGNASLYSRDYFTSCREKLSDRGVCSVWLPIYRISPADFKTVLATFHSVFTHCTVWFADNSLSRQVLLIGTMKIPEIDLSIWRDRVARAAITCDLREIYVADAYKLLDFLIMTEKEIREFSDNAPLHTDDRPRLEFSAPKSEDEFLTWKQNLLCMIPYKQRVATPLIGRDDHTLGQTMARYHAAASHVLHGLASHFEDPAVSLIEFRTALAMNPNDSSLYRLLNEERRYYRSTMIQRTRDLESAGNIHAACDLYRSMWAIDSGDRDLAIESARFYSRHRIFDAAEALLEGILRTDSTWAAGYHMLGVVHVKNHQWDAARAALDKAIALDPGFAEAYNTRAVAFIGIRRYDNALRDLNEALALSPENHTAYENRALVYMRLGRPDYAAQDEALARRYSPATENDQ